MTRIEAFEPRAGYDDVLALVKANKDEAESHIPLEVMIDLEAYEYLYQAGMLVLLGAYDGERMVGYAIASLSPSLHYGVVTAHHMTLYLAPSHRTPRTSLRMVEALAHACKDKGAVMMTWSAKPGSAFARLIARRARLEDFVFTQEL